jgi:hypothetical protein
MPPTDPTLISDAKSEYDRACGAVTGSDYTGFLLALSVGFWTGDHPAIGIVPTLVVQFSVAFLVLAIVRIYFRRQLRAAEDAYHRLAGIGKYAAAPSVDHH